VYSLQNACPNLVTFGLRNSNLTFHDLYYYDWKLWPLLNYLDLEENYTLVLLPESLPRHLKGLYVRNTGVRNFTAIKAFENLESFSCSLDSQTDIFNCLNMPCVKELKIYFTHFWKTYNKDYLATYLKNVPVVNASFLDYFNVKRCYLDLQEMCNGVVQCKM
jgi:hypothetical protein